MSATVGDPRARAEIRTTRGVTIRGPYETPAEAVLDLERERRRRLRARTTTPVREIVEPPLICRFIKTRRHRPGGFLDPVRIAAAIRQALSADDPGPALRRLELAGYELRRP